MSADLKDRLHCGVSDCKCTRNEAAARIEELEATNSLLHKQVARMTEQQNGYRPGYLLNGTRFKLNFSTRGNVDVFWNYAKELDGRWVALVPAEDDMHLAAAPTAPAEQDERAMFERWLIAHDAQHPVISGDGYADEYHQTQWMAWQARARIAALVVPAEPK